MITVFLPNECCSRTGADFKCVANVRLKTFSEFDQWCKKIVNEAPLLMYCTVLWYSTSMPNTSFSFSTNFLPNPELTPTASSPHSEHILDQFCETLLFSCESV